MSYQHILTIYDGTPGAEEMLDIVCKIAKMQRARLTILMVKLIPLSEKLPTYKAGVDKEMDALVAQTEKFSDKRGVKAATAVRYARALSTAALSEARTRGVDLITLCFADADMLTAGGDSGSDIDVILRQTTCAVMLCRPAPAEE